MASLSRSIFRSVLLKSSIPKPSNFSSSFSTKSLISSDNSDSEGAPDSVESDNDSSPFSSSSHSSDYTESQRDIFDRPLENGLDVGIYKAILVGQVATNPMQKRLRSGTIVTLLSLGTGGLRNNRRPLENEDPKGYANRSVVQWHRVSIYPTRLGELAMKHAVPGSILYVEGNLETKIFNDPVTGLVRHIREVALRRNGRLVFVGKGSDVDEESQVGVQRFGYF